MSEKEKQTGQEQPKLRFRMFRAVYSGPGVSRGSRIQIHDMRHGKRKYLNYDDGEDRTFEQATAYLRSIGISVDAIGLANKDHRMHAAFKGYSNPVEMRGRGAI